MITTFFELQKLTFELLCDVVPDSSLENCPTSSLASRNVTKLRVVRIAKDPVK